MSGLLSLGILCLLPSISAAGPSTPSLVSRAAEEFAQGDKTSACDDASAALQQDPSDEKALGIARMTCGEKAIDGKDFKAKKEAPEKTEKTDLKPKPLSGQANGPQQPPDQGQTGVSKDGLLVGLHPSHKGVNRLDQLLSVGGPRPWL